MFKDKTAKILKSVTEAIVKHEDAQVIMERATSAICQELAVDAAILITFNPQDEKLHIMAQHGLEENLKDFTFGPDEGISGTVFRTQQFINMASPWKHPNYKRFYKSNEESFNAYLGVPMLSGSSPVGVLTLLSTKKRKFHDDIVELANNLASQLSVIVSNYTYDFLLKGKPSASPKVASDARVQSTFIGTSVSPGHCFAKAQLLDRDAIWTAIKETPAEDIDEEMKHLEHAIDAARKETIQIQARATELFVEADASIFFAQLLFLEDPNLVNDIKNGILKDRLNAKSAVKNVITTYVQRFESMDNQQLKERALDLKDIGIRLLQQLSQEELTEELRGDEKIVLVGREVFPSDLVRVSTSRLRGIVCSEGGKTSHTAILARSLNIPAMVGVSGIDKYCKSGDKVLLDASQSLVYLNPSQGLLDKYKEQVTSTTSIRRPQKSSGKPAITKDGTKLEILGNVCMLKDLAALKEHNHDGIGLYRTEFMYMIHDTFPSENEQYRIYRKLISEVKDKPITIRILDVGGDKPLKYFDHGEESDPMLGWRSIRILLQRPEIFQPHLRALLRASQRGNVRLLFPMVSHYEDIVALKSVLSQTMKELRHNYGSRFSLPPIGVMVETPSIIWQLTDVLNEIDFVSIGTNDLVQYMFAADRGNNKVSNYFQPMHPIILRAIEKIVSSCRIMNKEVSICGEIGGDPQFLPLLLGLGLRDISMPPARMPEIQNLAGKLSIGDCVSLVQKVRNFRGTEEVQSEVLSFLRKKARKNS